MPHALSSEQDVPSLNGKKLFVNDGLLRPSQVGKLKESSPDIPMDELRWRYNEDGYVYLKGLLPKDDALKARGEYFKMLAPSSVLEPDFPGIGTRAAPGNGKPGEATAERFVGLALEAHYTDWYKETLCKLPVLKDFIARITGWGDNTLGVCRSLLRNNTPGNKAIGVHYDQIFLHHGEPTSVTSWVPLGVLSLTGSGLIYLENGHPLGREVEEDLNRKAAERGLSEEETKNASNQNMLPTGLLADGPREYSDTFDRRWLVTNYEAGDVVLHTPYTIYASTLNYDPENVTRVGTDLRFVDGSKTWDTRWDKDYELNDGV
ncbi:phytanoyl-CoA hydroxylase [Alternaria panax]|uniref:Phytanoyl-CoA hydroxylase n=1 Tax=Alternaria panax TaxID=48097 RepID=A0AAD4IJ23_9PLEO|nr:phytanoyl-CoA hydroxylase [Alternaria panax]